MVKVADEAPVEKEAVAGTVALVLLDDRFTEKPDWAGFARVTVTIEDFPPRTDAGLSTRPLIRLVKVSEAVALMPPDVAVIVTVVLAGTALVVIVNVAEVAPPGIFTDHGTVT